MGEANERGEFCSFTVRKRRARRIWAGRGRKGECGEGKRVEKERGND